MLVSITIVKYFAIYRSQHKSNNGGKFWKKGVSPHLRVFEGRGQDPPKLLQPWVRHRYDPLFLGNVPQTLDQYSNSKNHLRKVDVVDSPLG